jgi:hypothetical protein
MESSAITFRVVMFKSGDSWVAQCLEHDIAAQAKTPQDVPYQLERAIVGHLAIAKHQVLVPFENVPKAPERYWKMFKSGLKVEAPKTHRFKVKGFPRPVRPEFRLSELVLT